MKRKYLFLVVIIMSVTIFALIGCSDAEALEDLPEEAVEETRESIEVFGVVKSKNVQSVNVDIELKVLEVLCKTGDQVSKHDKILKFDKALIDNELDIYKQELELISSRMNKSDITTLQLQNSLADARSSLLAAEEKYNNDMKLVDNGIKTEFELKESKEVYNQLVSRVKDLKLAIENEAINNTFSDEESAVEYKKLSQKVQMIEDILNNKEMIDGDYIVAHIDSGVVAKLDVLAGDYIVPKTNIYELVDNSKLYIEAEVSEEFINEISIGQEIEVTPLFDKSKTITGIVEKINGLPLIKNGETIVPIEISIEDTEGFMLNFNVDVTIYLDKL
ncbi:MAG: efflux RND transporter periplasmic adaptor subunit [Clostridiales bacterium]|nr:efflux RND transporter periplasmic adaptor subunit [Clostridiales bacterium]